jgi:hypothetical protein
MKILQKLQTAENKKFPKPVKKVVEVNMDSAKSAKNALANMKMDVDEMDILLRSIVKKDIEKGIRANEINKFERRFIEEDIKQVSYLPWETIFKDEKSALLKCYEIVK